MGLNVSHQCSCLREGTSLAFCTIVDPLGYTRPRRCEFTDRLLQRCSCRCTKDSHGQAAACVERGCTRRHRYSEVWPRSASDTARRASLAWRPRLGVLQAGCDSWPVSERSYATVPVGLLCPGRRCWHSAPSAFRQPSATSSTSLPAQQLRSTGLFSCRLHSLELSLGFYPGPDHQCRVQTVSDVCLRRIRLLDTSAFRASEVLDDYCAI